MSRIESLMNRCTWRQGGRVELAIHPTSGSLLEMRNLPLGVGGDGGPLHQEDNSESDRAGRWCLRHVDAQAVTGAATWGRSRLCGAEALVGAHSMYRWPNGSSSLARPCLGWGQSGWLGPTYMSGRAVPAHGLHTRPRHDLIRLGPCGRAGTAQRHNSPSCFSIE